MIKFELKQLLTPLDHPRWLHLHRDEESNYMTRRTNNTLKQDVLTVCNNVFGVGKSISNHAIWFPEVSQRGHDLLKEE